MKKKKKSIYGPHHMRHSTRMKHACRWLADHPKDDIHIVARYRKSFHQEIHQSMRDLRELGVDLTPELIQQAYQDENRRIRAIHARKEAAREKRLKKEQEYLGCDDDFSYIAGYTSGGAPYGTTWEEIGIDQDLSFDKKMRKLDEISHNEIKKLFLEDAGISEEQLPFDVEDWIEAEEDDLPF